MDTKTKMKVGVATTALAIGLASVGYYFHKRRFKVRDAVDAFKFITIKTITKEAECDIVVSELRRRCKIHRAVGFDCEWVTEHGKRHPVALLQLASLDGYCALFRLNKLKYVPNTLKELLEDESIYKVGVAPIDDGKYLCKDYGVCLKSTLDVRHLALLCGHEPGGLAALAVNVLRVALDKSWRVRCSDWEAEELSERQTKYAAADAYVAIKIFVELVNEYSRGPWFFMRKWDNGVWDNLDNLCWKYSDVHFKTLKAVKLKNEVVNGEKPIKEPINPRKYANSLRTKPLYHNCFLEAPDGESLCTCDVKKALWYVDKQLADVVKEDPLTVRLRFEPAGRSVGDVGRYYQLVKENKCVVCGKTDSYIRKNVVPREYRKYFPDVMKDHSSHDILLLCMDCHQRSNMLDQAVRERLANTCNAPLDSRDKFTEDANAKKIRSAARALLYQAQKHKLPDERRKQLEKVVLEHYPDHQEVTEELLKEASKETVLVENTDFESHGEKVVDYYLVRPGGLLKLEEVWREHFLTSMQPKYLPDLWSTKHNEERLRVKWDEGRLSKEDLKLIGITDWI